MMNSTIFFSLDKRRQVTLCNHNFSQEGILHPDRIMNEYDLLYMQKGTWDIIENEITYHLSSGDILILEPGKHHYSMSKCSPLMRNIYVHFSYDTNDQLSSPISVSPDFCTGKQTPNYFISNYLAVPKMIQTVNHPEIRHLLEQIIDAFWSEKNNTKELRCSILLENLLLKLSDFGLESNIHSDILISEIIHRFHCELNHFFSPEELSKDYHVSVRTISGKFKKQTGQSIHQYQISMKLDMIYDLLPFSPGRTLHDIALSYGFYDEFQLSKLFKRKFGFSPSNRRTPREPKD